jgi:mRNA interferase HigB
VDVHAPRKQAAFRTALRAFGRSHEAPPRADDEVRPREWTWGLTDRPVPWTLLCIAGSLRAVSARANTTKAWHSEAERAKWKGPADIRARYRTADFLANDRVVFNIKGNKYRLIVQVKYGPLYLVFIRFVGTHAEYDEIDANTV